ncbi:MAG: glycoside hydrolase family 9 protein [Clostridium sp.]|nr:glycoside hydrolase family 9 protein [Clostridium sp.]
MGKERKRRVIFGMLNVLLLVSCVPAPEKAEEGEIPLQMEEAPVLDYTLPKMYPSIWVNRRGYDADAEKMAVLNGADLPDTFRLVEKATGEVVYTGAVEKGRYYDTGKEYNSYGNFTEFTQEGEYYIECAIVGRSYPFRIGNRLTRELMTEVEDDIRKAASTEGLPFAKGASGEIGTKTRDGRIVQSLVLLLAYELYPDTFGDQDGNQVPDLLETLTEMVKSLRTLQDPRTGEAPGCHYAYAAVLAKYSYLYQKCDGAYATECLNLADQAWRFGEKTRTGQESEPEEAYRMLAAAELYRATGGYQYRAVVLEDGAAMQTADSSANGQTVSANGQTTDSGILSKENRIWNLAKITYISTKQRVDVNLCNSFIRGLMREAEDIVARIAELNAFAGDASAQGRQDPASLTTEETDDLVWDLILLTVVEYIIANHEYDQVIEARYHYFMGRNPQSYCFWEPDPAEASAEEGEIRIPENPVWTAGFLMILSKMAAGG